MIDSDISMGAFMTVLMIPCVAYMAGTEQWGVAAILALGTAFCAIRTVRRVLLNLKISRLRKQIQEQEQA